MKGLLIAYPQDITFSTAYASPTGEFVLDLYKDEPIPFQFKIDDFTNVAEKSSSNSKSFEIPGTKNNNVFFNHIYEITSDSEFNPHKKTKVIYKEDGFDIFVGYLQLNDIVIKNNNVSYEITLYSETINLKEELEKKTFRDLDLTELQHNYYASNIKNSFTGNTSYTNASTSGFRTGASVKYPLIKWNDSSSYFSGLLTAFFTSDLFRPFVNCKYLLERIISDAGFTFTSTFLSSTDFTKLYIDFNADAAPYNALQSFIVDTPSAQVYSATYTTIDLDTIVDGVFLDGSDYYDLSSNQITALLDNTTISATITFTISNITPGANANLSFRRLKNGNQAGGINTYFNIQNGDTISTTLGISGNNLDAGDTLEVQVKCQSGTTFQISEGQIEWHIISPTIDFNQIVNSYRGNINQWEYFKNFIDRFNLLVLGDEDNPNNLIIEPYNDYIDSGNTLDWTSKIDDREIKYTPIDGLAKFIDYKLDEDSSDAITINQDNPNDWKFNYNYEADIEIYDKDKEEFKVKGFASTDVDYLGPAIQLPIIMNNDGTNWNNKPRILYDVGVQNLTGNNYLYFPGFLSYQQYLLFLPVDEFPITANTKSLDFGVVDYGLGSPVLFGLFNEYWAKYIDELYHKDTRIAKVKAYITAKDLNEFTFKDIIMIKNRKYRVKMIDYKADSLSILELITIKDL